MGPPELDGTPGSEVTGPDGPPATFTASHRSGLARRQADHGRTLDAVHGLEAALASAAPGRQGAWRATVADALEALEQATAEEDRNAGLPESLLSDIARTQPRLRHRVRGLRVQYRHVHETIAALRHELHETGEVDAADVRQRLAWLLVALRHQRARESDLIYEAYYEAFNRDLGEERESGR